MLPRKDLYHFDASDRAVTQLDREIKLDENRLAKNLENKVSVYDAIRQRKVFKIDDNRNTTRVLFISRNTELLNPSQQTLDGYIDVSSLFAEVHILILRPGIPAKQPVTRIGDNVWLYTATAKHWWGTIKAGHELAVAQLEFASGFRPDLIVARDPFECAEVAQKLGEQYRRPTQLHVLEDFYSKQFSKQAKHNFWRKFIANRSIKNFYSIRTSTNQLLTKLQTKVMTEDIATLPKFNDYEALIESDATIDLKTKHKPLTFFMLTVSFASNPKSVFEIIDAAKNYLRNPRVGLIIIGNQSIRSEIEQRAKVLGIYNQIVMITKEIELTTYLKSTNLLIVNETSQQSEDLVIRGAAVGIPIIMAKTEQRADAFVNGESAMMVEPGAVAQMTGAINVLMNNFNMRKKFVAEGQKIVRHNFHTDPNQYLVEYRNSIESAILQD